MNYRVFETEGFHDDLQLDFGGRRKKILEKLRNFVYPQLRSQPHLGPNIRKLKDYSPETWRYRIGEYRFFYQIEEDDKIIFMIAAESRFAPG
ncbi:MAG: type II toxin-antitoxin system RelE/ParE family toxin [Desulfobulbaceae bacterium]|nr:type II toxin-antitoxin system RelE/ParE family toxin [Desulfobulbaceae bacterium]